MPDDFSGYYTVLSNLGLELGILLINLRKAITDVNKN